MQFLHHAPTGTIALPTGRVSSFLWGTLCFSSMDLLDICSQVTEVIQITKKSRLRHQESWISMESDKIKLVKFQDHKPLLKNPSPENWQLLVEDSDNRNAFNNWVINKVLSYPNASKSYWTLAKMICQNFGESSFPPLICENEIVSTLKGKTDFFAKQIIVSNICVPEFAPTETIISSNNIKYFKTNQHIHDRHYEFRHVRTTGDFLTFVTHSWTKSLEFPVINLLATTFHPTFFYNRMLLFKRLFNDFKKIMNWGMINLVQINAFNLYVSESCSEQPS